VWSLACSPEATGAVSEELLLSFYDVPINKFLHYELVSRTPGETVISMDVRPEFLQEEGLVQGGILSAIADTAAVYTFLPDLDESQNMTSIEFKVNFLKPASPGSGPIIARARVVQRGRKVGVCEVEVSQGDSRVLKGLFTYLFYPRSE
jgi:uncharacterized protein (TIGR00369 family)